MTTLAGGGPKRLPPHRRTQSRAAVPRALLVGLLWTLAVAGFGVLTVPVPRAIASDYERHGSSPSYVFDSSVVSTTLAEVPRAATLVTTHGDAGRSGPATCPLALSLATKGAGSGLDDLARAAAGPGKGGQTAVGHALQKHGDRPRKRLPTDHLAS